MGSIDELFGGGGTIDELFAGQDFPGMPQGLRSKAKPPDFSASLSDLASQESIPELPVPPMLRKPPESPGFPYKSTGNVFADSADAAMQEAGGGYADPNATGRDLAGRAASLGAAALMTPAAVASGGAVLGPLASGGLPGLASAAPGLLLRGAAGAGFGALESKIPVIGSGRPLKGALEGAAFGIGLPGIGPLWRYGMRKKGIKNAVDAIFGGQGAKKAEETALREAAAAADLKGQMAVEEAWNAAQEAARKAETKTAESLAGKATKEGLGVEQSYQKAVDAARKKAEVQRALAESRNAREGISTENAWLKAQEKAKRAGVPQEIPLSEARQRASAEAASVQDQIAVENQWLKSQAKAGGNTPTPTPPSNPLEDTIQELLRTKTVSSRQAAEDLARAIEAQAGRGSVAKSAKQIAQDVSGAQTKTAVQKAIPEVAPKTSNELLSFVREAAKTEGRKPGEKVWVLLQGGKPVKTFATPDEARGAMAAIKKAGAESEYSVTWAKAGL